MNYPKKTIYCAVGFQNNCPIGKLIFGWHFSSKYTMKNREMLQNVASKLNLFLGVHRVCKRIETFTRKVNRFGIEIQK